MFIHFECKQQASINRREIPARQMLFNCKFVRLPTYQMQKVILKACQLSVSGTSGGACGGAPCGSNPNNAACQVLLALEQKVSSSLPTTEDFGWLTSNRT